MKIYTRTGDRGTTALFGGDRVPKYHPRIDAYGTVDEANSFLGLARAHLPETPAMAPLLATLARLQNEMFIVGADLATPSEGRPVVPRIAAEHVAQLEADIDQYEADLPPLKAFILPGGTPAAATLHVARTVCRRAERLAVEARTDADLNLDAIIYLNRLSDLLFVLARWQTHHAGATEIEWHPA